MSVNRSNIVLDKPQFGFITGASGSGKHWGVGSILKEFWPVEIFVSGDWCRQNQAEHAKNGVLVSDDTITDAGIEHFLRERGSRRASEIMHFLFDAPRTLKQAQHFVQFFHAQGCESMENIHTFDLRTSPRTAWNRISDRAIRHGRDDDKNPKTIARRLTYYFGKPTDGFEAPDNLVYSGEDGVLSEVIPWLQMNTTFHLIDGDQDLDTVVRHHVRDVIGVRAFGMVRT